MDAESELTVAAQAKSLGHSLVRSVGNFVAGFQRATWDRRADETIVASLREVGELRSLSKVDTQRIEALLNTRRPFLRSEFAVELIANRLTLILGISAVLVPGVLVGLNAPRVDDPVWVYAVMLIGILAVATWPALALETLTGRDRAGLVWMALVISSYMAIAVWYAATSDRTDPENPTRGPLVAAATAWTCLVIVLVARVYVVAWNRAALNRAWTEVRVEARVVSNLLAVLQILEQATSDDDNDRRPMKSTGNARALLADAAEAVNDHLPRLIDGRRAFSADAEATAREAAAALLDLRSAVTLPGGRVRDEDLERLKTTVEKWSIGSLADLPRLAPPDAEPEESERRRSGLRQNARTFALGVIPLILLIIVTLLPLKLSGAVTEALTPFAVTWLLLSVAAVLAPADVKVDTKTLFNL
jgi:hypothetical protein